MDPKLGNSTISHSSSSSEEQVADNSIAETKDDREDDEDKVNEGDAVVPEDGEVDDDGDEKSSNLSMAAAFAAAAWTSRGLRDDGRGSDPASSGKLSIADVPLMLRAATSWARAAISGDGKVPSQMRDFFRGSRISETHLPQLRIRTPR